MHKEKVKTFLKYFFAIFFCLILIGFFETDKYTVYQVNELYNDDGKVYSVNTDELFTGSTIEIWNQGTTKFQNVYEKGKKVEILYYFPSFNGGSYDVRSKFFLDKNGKQTGNVITYFKSGEIDCKVNKITGITKCFYESGEIKTVEDFKNNIKKYYRKSGKVYKTEKIQ